MCRVHFASSTLLRCPAKLLHTPRLAALWVPRLWTLLRRCRHRCPCWMPRHGLALAAFVQQSDHCGRVSRLCYVGVSSCACVGGCIMEREVRRRERERETVHRTRAAVLWGARVDDGGSAILKRHHTAQVSRLVQRRTARPAGLSREPLGGHVHRPTRAVGVGGRGRVVRGLHCHSDTTACMDITLTMMRRGHCQWS